MIRLIIIVLGGFLGAYLFSKYDENKNKQKKDEFENFWYKYNNPSYRSNSRYNNHCWKCGKAIDSYYQKKCSVCGWYICSQCGACSNYPNCEESIR